MSAKKIKMSDDEIGIMYANLFAKSGLVEKFSEPSFFSAWLKSGRLVEMMKLDQPKPPRSANRRKQGNDPKNSEAVRAGIWATKFPLLKGETIDPLIEKSLEDGTAEKVFEAIAEGAKIASSKPKFTTFSRHVITAFMVATHIMDTEKRIPTKDEIKEKVNGIFSENSWNGFQDDMSRWTEFFTAAGLSDLPQANPKHTAKQHGMDSPAKRIRKSRHR